MVNREWCVVRCGKWTDAEKCATPRYCFLTKGFQNFLRGMLMCHDRTVRNCKMLSAACGDVDCLTNTNDLIAFFSNKSDRFLAAVAVHIAHRPALEKRPVLLPCKESIPGLRIVGAFNLHAW